MENKLIILNIIIIILGCSFVTITTSYFLLIIKNKNVHKLNVITVERKAIQSIINSKEEILARLSRELHDDVGARLFGIKMILKNDDEPIVDKCPPEIKSWIKTLNKEIETLSFDVRNLSHEYAPYVQDIKSLRNALTNFIHRINSRNELNCKLSIEDYQLNFLDPSIALETYRIITELLKNIISHAKASNAIVTVSSKSTVIHIEVEDNGIGIPTDIPSGKSDPGIGIRNIQTRVSLSGGNINFSNGQNGNGTKVVIELPKHL